MTVWSYYVLRENKPHVLEDLPPADDGKRVNRENGVHQEVSNGDQDQQEHQPAPEIQSVPPSSSEAEAAPDNTEAASDNTDTNSVQSQVRFYLLFFVFLPLNFFTSDQANSLKVPRD